MTPMKEEIAKILGMAQSGQITNEQATELIAALASPADAGPRVDPHASPEEEFSRGARPGAKGLGAVAAEFASKMLDLGTKLHRTDAGNNSVTMSRYSVAKGERFAFEDNEFNVSNVSGLELYDSEMKDNELQASNFSGVALTDGSINDCEFNGSSVSDFTLESASFVDCEVNGSKLSRLHFKDSSMNDCEFNGCAIKGFELSGGSTVNDLELQGVAWNDVKILRGHLNDTEMHGVAFHGVVLEDVELNDCEFHKVRLTNVTIRNVKLSDLELHNVKLQDQTIDGDDEFLRAVKKRA